MYFKDDKQISLFEFGQSAGMELDPENRWVKIADKVDWNKIEDKYCVLFCPDNDAPGKSIRLAICSLLISSMEGLPDERLVLHIQENPYMQYFCGIKEFSRDLPFTPSLMVTFRKRFGDDIIHDHKDVAVR